MLSCVVLICGMSIVYSVPSTCSGSCGYCGGDCSVSDFISGDLHGHQTQIEAGEKLSGWLRVS